MELFVHLPSARAFRNEVRQVTTSLPTSHDRGWKSHGDDAIDPVEPVFEWLGHPHEESSYFFRKRHDTPDMMSLLTDCYGLDWDDLSACQDLRSAHESLAHLDATEVSRRVASYVQAWLSLGLLEAVCGRAIPTSCMVRSGPDGSSFLYTPCLAALLESWRRGFSSNSQFLKL